MYPTPTLSLLPESDWTHPDHLAGTSWHSFLSPIHEARSQRQVLAQVRFCALTLVIRKLPEQEAAVSPKGSECIRQGSEIKASSATVHCQLKKIALFPNAETTSRHQLRACYKEPLKSLMA